VSEIKLPHLSTEGFSWKHYQASRQDTVRLYTAPQIQDYAKEAVELNVSDVLQFTEENKKAKELLQEAMAILLKIDGNTALLSHIIEFLNKKDKRKSKK
jgi:hypothetical protein